MTKWLVIYGLFSIVVVLIWIGTTNLITDINPNSWWSWNNMYKLCHLTKEEAINVNLWIMSAETVFFAWLFGWKYEA
jgi:hypothetical protein